MPLYRATASNLTNLVAADGSSGGFVKDAQAGAGGLALLDDADIAAVQQTLASAGSAYGPARVLFRLIGANMNSTADQQFTKLGTFSSYYLAPGNAVRIDNGSTSLTTAVGGIYTAASKGGSQMVANTQVYSGVTGSGLGFNLSLTAAGSSLRTETPYLSLTTPQGATATLDFYLFGFPIS